MLDSDGDHNINGADFCPFTDAPTVDTNQGGEKLAFPITDSSPARLTHYGYAYRGNACDPFETTFVRPSFPNPGTQQWTDCRYIDPNHPYYETTSSVQINYAAVFGLSANDPALSAGTTYASRAQILLDKSKTNVPVTLERCACQSDVLENVRAPSDVALLGGSGPERPCENLRQRGGRLAPARVERLSARPRRLLQAAVAHRAPGHPAGLRPSRRHLQFPPGGLERLGRGSGQPDLGLAGRTRQVPGSPPQGPVR